MKITITQTGKTDNGFTATLKFGDRSTLYPFTVQNPFNEEEEKQLEWYFEKWLTFPFTGHVKAGEAAKSITTYGEQLFKQIFTGEIKTRYQMALEYEGGFEQLEVEVSGDPDFHALHWEALKDPQFERPIAIEATFVRPNLRPTATDIRSKPSPTLNILLVTARPGGRRDVSYRTISRPLVTALRNSHIRAQIDMVRPGTFAALEKHLEDTRDNPERGDGYYHIIHFDLHGKLYKYDEYKALKPESTSSRHLFREPDTEAYGGVKAFLSFNGPKPGQSERIIDDKIADLLKRHRIPIAILNACQSGKQVGETETSLGSRLMAAGVQTALAMGYSVSVTAAERLMTHLYEQLLAGQPPTTSWVWWPRNSGSGRRPNPITSKPCKSPSNSMTATARHPPTTSWAWWPRN